MIPPVLPFAEFKFSSLSSTHPVTERKSETKLGTWHFIKASFPRMTNSSPIRVSKGDTITKRKDEKTCKNKERISFHLPTLKHAKNILF